MRAPDFWFSEQSAWGSVLGPLGCLYAAGGRVKRAFSKPEKVGIPVICIGNLVAGGAGKTPVVQSLARQLLAMGRHPSILLRGYGGSETGPLLVDPVRHTAKSVGDEALLHASIAPTWISSDRAMGARAAIAQGADVILMDDGFQNSGLFQDLPILVVDGETGFGNGRVIPAGPLREPVADGVKRAKAVVLIGPDKCEVLPRLKPLPVFKARIVADATNVSFHNSDVVAFAGIGRPQKFFATLQEQGAKIAMAFPFPDHHAYTECEIEALLEQAKDLQARLVTTAKDHVRLPKDVQERVEVLKISLRWDDETAPQRLFAAIGLNA
ncbi:Tetraacyldisaccharide 4'-kinase [Rhodospirillaceae bacterium LM-1]|nr:Tetraacyldisaccharide 4'-kinase [Rhodospirillaceae bacterium LM-1]